MTARPPGTSNTTSPGLALQDVPSDHVARIQRLMHKNDLTSLEQYLRERNGQGLFLPYDFKLGADEETMVCFVKDQITNIDCEGEAVSVPLSQQRQVLGLPVVRSSVFSKYFKNKRYTFATSRSTSGDQVRCVAVPSLDSVHMERGDDGELVVDVHQNLLTSPEESSTENSGDLVILNGERSEWSSVQFRRVRTNKEAVSFVLDMIPEESQQEFCAELDEKGWNLLHWTCYQDKHEILSEAMNKLELEDQYELMTTATADDKGWTLLHCAAVKNAGKTLKELMSRFPDENIKWQQFRSQAADGKTALHLAVAEQNVKAVIVLLDEAANLKADPLCLTDTNNLSPIGLTSEDSLLGKYLRFCWTHNGISLQELVKRDDEQLVSLRLTNLSDTTIAEAINERNSEGLTVLQTAIEAQAWNVLNLLTHKLSDQLPPQEFEKCILEQTPNGDSALHILARSNEPSRLHMLLQCIPRESRLNAIQQRNNEDKDVLEVGRDFKPVTDVVKFHRWLLKQDLEKVFKEFHYSLFKVNIHPRKLEDLYRRIENRTERELGYRRNVNYDANKCLRFGDYEKARGLIRDALTVDPSDIHALCNWGLFLLAQENIDLREAESVAIKVINEYASEDGKQRLYAGVDYAYWLAEIERTYNARQKSCEIFQECIDEATNCADSAALQAYCGYFYTKILVRWVKDEPEQEEDWYKTRFDEMLIQLVRLSHADRQAYGGEVWLWLAEMQSNILHRRSHADVEQTLMLFQNHCIANLDCSDLRPAACIAQAQSMLHHYDYNRKFMMRIGKISLDISYEQIDVETRRPLLQSALKVSEECSNNSTDWYFMCASTSAQALLHLWAIEFYSENREMVDRQYRHRIPDGNYFTPKVINFLVDQYHHKSCLRNSRWTSEYLNAAKRYLQQIIDRSSDGWKTHGVKYARVMHLLGYRKEEIVHAFQQSLQALECEGNHGRHKYIQGLQSFGLFYELSKDFCLALHYYDQSLKLQASRGNIRRSIAQRGMDLIRQYEPNAWHYYMNQPQMPHY